jgi:hypothetical protein
MIMKKSAVLLLALTIISFTAYSQVGVGIRAGVNFSNIDFEDIDSDSKTGFHFGVFANAKLGDVFAFQPEILYSTIGAEFNDTDDINFDYLAIPLLIQANIGIFNVYAGPQLGLIANVEGNGIDDDDFKSTDWSMILGAGVDLPLRFEAGARYLYGLSDVSDIDDFGKVNNHTWQLVVSWQLFGER